MDRLRRGPGGLHAGGADGRPARARDPPGGDRTARVPGGYGWRGRRATDPGAAAHRDSSPGSLFGGSTGVLHGVRRELHGRRRQLHWSADVSESALVWVGPGQPGISEESVVFASGANLLLTARTSAGEFFCIAQSSGQTDHGRGVAFSDIDTMPECTGGMVAGHRRRTPIPAGLRAQDRSSRPPCCRAGITDDEGRQTDAPERSDDGASSPPAGPGTAPSCPGPCCWRNTMTRAMIRRRLNDLSSDERGFTLDRDRHRRHDHLRIVAVPRVHGDGRVRLRGPGASEADRDRHRGRDHGTGAWPRVGSDHRRSPRQRHHRRGSEPRHVLRGRCCRHVPALFVHSIDHPTRIRARRSSSRRRRPARPRPPDIRHACTPSSCTVAPSGSEKKHATRGGRTTRTAVPRPPPPGARR